MPAEDFWAAFWSAAAAAQLVGAPVATSTVAGFMTPAEKTLITRAAGRRLATTRGQDRS